MYPISYFFRHINSKDDISRCEFGCVTFKGANTKTSSKEYHHPGKELFRNIIKHSAYQLNQ